MTNIRFHRSALFAACLAIGLAGAAGAQAPGPTSPAPTPPATSGSTGMDKGAGTGAASTRAGDSKASTAKSADMQLPATERRFLEKAGRDGMAEVQLGQLAQQRAQDAQVKDLGRRMAEDHGKANDQLKTLASAKGVTLPTEPDSAHKRLADKLGKASGADFDRLYTKEMVDDHEKDVKAFRQMAKSAKDPEVRSFASAQLPTLEEHLRMAQAAHSGAAKGGTATRTTTGSSATTTGAAGTGTSGTKK